MLCHDYADGIGINDILAGVLHACGHTLDGDEQRVVHGGHQRRLLLVLVRVSREQVEHLRKMGERGMRSHSGKNGRGPIS